MHTNVTSYVIFSQTASLLSSWRYRSFGQNMLASRRQRGNNRTSRLCTASFNKSPSRCRSCTECSAFAFWLTCDDQIVESSFEMAIDQSRCWTASQSSLVPCQSRSDQRTRWIAKACSIAYEGLPRFVNASPNRFLILAVIRQTVLLQFLAADNGTRMHFIK